MRHLKAAMAAMAAAGLALGVAGAAQAQLADPEGAIVEELVVAAGELRGHYTQLTPRPPPPTLS